MIPIGEKLEVFHQNQKKDSDPQNTPISNIFLRVLKGTIKHGNIIRGVTIEREEIQVSDGIH